MIRELVELAERNRKKAVAGGKIVHNSIQFEKANIYLYINEKGEFKDFQLLSEPQETLCEAITSKKGKARLLVDKLEETLGLNVFDEKAPSKNELYLSKLKEFSNVECLQPVLKFYFENNNLGVVVAKKRFENQIQSQIKETVEELQKKPDKKSKKTPEETAKEKIQKVFQGNIAFMIGDQRLNEDESIIQAIISKYDEKQNSFTRKKCSVCGKENYPVEDLPHGMIKRVPDGQTAGSALISFNEPAFLSYKLVGNMNSQVCTNCARAYTESLNWLLAPSGFVKSEKGKDKPIFNNRYDFGKDTASVFWTKNDTSFNPKKFMEASSSNDIQSMFKSLDKGVKTYTDTNDFYAFTLSGSAARIMVRDYIHMSVQQVEKNLKQWFEDIDIGIKDGDATRYTPLWRMKESVRRPNDSKNNDMTPARVQTYLWRAALQNISVPLWPLYAVVNRIRMDSYKLSIRSSDDKSTSSLSFGQIFSASRISLIKLILNRLNKGEKIMKGINEKSGSIAYNCGRIFAVLAKIQYNAAKRDVNVGVVNRFYSATSTTPSAAFGRLFKNAQNHLAKIASGNRGQAVNLEKQLSELVSLVGDFPQTLNLEDQGRFALGFYQQRNADFQKGEVEADVTDEGDGLENAPEEN